MSNDNDEFLAQGRVHRVRGVIVSIVLGPLMVLFGVNAAVALIAQFFGGWAPSSWFSSSIFDWLFAGGIEGGAGNYVAFMVNAVLSSGCFAVIKWAFTGRTD